VHSIIDDCSRLAYSEIHDDETAVTVTAFTERALAAKGARVSFVISALARVSVVLSRCTRTRPDPCPSWRRKAMKTVSVTARTTIRLARKRRLRPGRYRVTVQPLAAGSKRAMARLRVR
jgi:hypothetical protein